MIIVRQGSSIGLPLGPFVDSTDGFTPETALSITQAEVRIKKGGAAWAQCNEATTATHEEEGWYEKALDATDTGTTGRAKIAVYVTGALPVWEDMLVLPALVFDALIDGTDKLEIDAVQWLGGTIVTPTVTGVPEVDVTHAAGAAQASIATQASVDTIDDLLDTEVAAIKADTAAILIDTAEIGAAGAGLTALATQASVNTIDDLLDTEVAAIKADTAAILIDTAEIGVAGAGLTALATQASVNTIDDLLDTEIAALQTSLNTIDDFLDTEIAAIKAKTDNLPAAPAATGDIPTATQIATEVYDQANGVETGITLRQTQRVLLAASSGKLSGAATTSVAIRNLADSLDRITATVDADGNRSAVTLNLG